MIDSGTELNHVLERHRAFWECTPVERPLLWTTSFVPWAEWGPYYLRDGTGVSDGMRVDPGMLDLGAALRSAVVQLEPSPKLKEVMAGLETSVRAGREIAILDGDFLAGLEPYPFPWMEAILGCPVYHEKGSFWAAPVQEDWSELAHVGGWQSSPWLVEMTSLRAWLTQVADGQVPVGSPLFRGPFDMAVGAIGAGEFCMAAVDRPAELERFMAHCTEIYLSVAEGWFAEIPLFHGGYCLEGYWGLLAPGSAVRFQSDNSYMISPRQYREQFLGFDRQVTQAFEYPAIGTHTSQANHLTAYAEIPELRMVEVALEAPPFGRPPLELLPQFRVVQEAGKALLLQGTTTSAEMDGLLRGLSPTGLALRLSIRGDDQRDSR